MFVALIGFVVLLYSFEDDGDGDCGSGLALTESLWCWCEIARL